MLSKSEFESLTPRTRGYVVYMAGSRDDQLNVPDESNPYPSGSCDALEWDEGQHKAVLEAQDEE